MKRFLWICLLTWGCRPGEPAAPPPCPEAVIGDLGLAFVSVPAGWYNMGDADLAHEGPVHRVEFDKPFLMSRFEITQEVWQAVMGENPSFYKDPHHPVENISWLDVQAFIEKLNGLTAGRTYRLPTEAEWEYAARAGSTSKFCFGDDFQTLDAYAWTRRNAGKKHHPAGMLKPNAWGLYDMHGNVWEWCSDYFAPDAYAHHEPVNPKGPAQGGERVYRGGSFHYAPQYSQSAWRLWFREDYRSIFIGFRLIMEVEDTP